MLPGIINHLGSDGLAHLKRLAASVRPSIGGVDDDADIPELVENFDSILNSEDDKIDEVNVDEAIDAKSQSTIEIDAVNAVD